MSASSSKYMSGKILQFCFIAGLTVACSEEEPALALTTYNESLIEYFNDLAFGFEFGGVSEVTRKWTTDMKIFVGGNNHRKLVAQLRDIVGEINTLATDGISAAVVTGTLESNFYDKRKITNPTLR